MSYLSNKVAVITGGNSGIGLATAKLFASHGAKLVLFGRNAETLAQAGNEIPGSLTVQGDTANLADLDRLVAATTAQYPHVDVLFLNAGIAFFNPIEAVDEQFFDDHFNVNVRGLYFGIQKFLPHLRDGASIVLNASIVYHKGFAGSSVYTATKAAVRSFAKTLAAELAPRQIRVNVVSPGPIATPIYGRMGMPEDAMKSMGEGFAAQVPLKRFGEAEEVAKAVLFLASANSSYVNGTEIRVDGGLSEV